MDLMLGDSNLAIFLYFISVTVMSMLHQMKMLETNL